MHMKKVAKQNPESADVGPTPEALTKAEVVTISPPRHTNALPVSRKQGMHERLERKGAITAAEWTWADRYCEELERVMGARPGRPDVETGKEYHGPAIYDRQAQAATFIRLSDARLGRHRAVFISACVEAHRICDVAIVCGIYPGDDETMDAFKGRVNKRVEAAVTAAIRSGVETHPKKIV